jgi:cytochrome c biogenesis protein ResB
MKQNAFKRSWRWLAHPSVLAVLIVVLLAVLLLGTLLPQLPGDALDAAQLVEWRALAQARYGSLAPVLEAAGAHRLYRTPLLWAPLVLLSTATLACLVQRCPAYWRAATRQPVRLPQTALDAASHVCTLESLPPDVATRLDNLSGIVHRTLVTRDYRVRAESDPDLAWLRGDRNRLSPLGAVVEHVAVLVILAGVCLSLFLGWREILVIEPGATVEVGHGTGIALRNDGFEVERYADGSPAAYTARMTVESRGTAARRDIGVNRPAAELGTRLILQSYSPVGSRYAVSLLAVHDPGYPVVVAGGLLFLASIVVTLYFPRSAVHVRLARSGALRLAGWADRRATDFDREFADLAAALVSTGYWKPEADGSLPEGSDAPGTARLDG